MTGTETDHDARIIRIPQSLLIRPKGRALAVWPWVVSFLIVLACWGLSFYLAYPGNVQAINLQPFQAIEKSVLPGATPSLLYTVYITLPFTGGLLFADFSAGILAFALTQVIVYAAILSYSAYWIRTKGAPLWLTFLLSALVGANVPFSQAVLNPDPSAMIVAFTLLLMMRLYDMASGIVRIPGGMHPISQVVLIMGCLILLDARTLVLLVPTAVVMVVVSPGHRISRGLAAVLALLVALAIRGPLFSYLGWSTTTLTALTGWESTQFTFTFAPALVVVLILFVLFILIKAPRFLSVFVPLGSLWLMTVAFGAKNAAVLDLAYLFAIPLLCCMPFIRDISVEKKYLRRQMLGVRKSVSPADRMRAEQEVCDALLERLSTIDPQKGHIGLYAAQGSELALDRLAVRLGERGYRIAYPAMVSDTEIDFYTTAGSSISDLNSTELLSAPNKIIGQKQLATFRHIPPTQICALVVPAIAYDAQGYRLGHGGGYYDRYLRRAGKKVPTWGAGFKAQMVDSLPVERHDIRLKSVIVG